MRSLILSITPVLILLLTDIGRELIVKSISYVEFKVKKVLRSRNNKKEKAQKKQEND